MNKEFKSYKLKSTNITKLMIKMKELKNTVNSNKMTYKNNLNTYLNNYLKFLYNQMSQEIGKFFLFNLRNILLESQYN